MSIFTDKKTYILDGAMGTQIMDAGVEIGKCFEELNITHPEIIQRIHTAYIEAGADIVETNTFGGSPIKLKKCGMENMFYKVNFDGVRIAKKAAGGRAFVAASMGPLGELMEPMGSMSFDEAFDNFAKQAKVFEEAGADLISIETMSDIQEARAALIAVKTVTKLPVIVHMTYDEKGRTLTGTPPEVAAVILESLGADAIGANCSSGPAKMLGIARKLLKATSCPVSIMANAGNPIINGDSVIYKMTPEKYAPYAQKMAEIGVKMIGGCCGTTPGHIAVIKSQIPNPKSQHGKRISYQGIGSTYLASRTLLVKVKPTVIIGERINPTNRKDIQAQLLNGEVALIRQEAVSQVAAGAGVLDVNVGFAEIDEKAAMKKSVIAVQSAVEVPLCIDSSDPEAIEEGLKNFAGRALLNSVNGKKESLDKILPIAKKYGACIIGLTIDEGGIKSKASERISIAKKIIESANSVGINAKDIFIDFLTLSAGVQQEVVYEIVKAVAFAKKNLGVRTVLGVSNISHGLPDRKKLNAAFLKLAGKNGLDAAIYNPENLKISISDEIERDAMNVFKNVDKGSRQWIGKYGQMTKSQIPNPKTQQGGGQSKTIFEIIKEKIISGDKEGCIVLVGTSLGLSAQEKINPQAIIDQALLPGIEEVGRKFSSGEYFIPQVMASAQAMKAAFEIVKKYIKVGDKKHVGTVIIATVHGDIHDIGKNIVAMLMENHGFTVIDLGRDVAAQTIVDEAVKNKADAIMLSALLTTTMKQMKVVDELLKQKNIQIPVFIGGAPVTDGFAKSFGAGFARNAVDAVEEVKKFIKLKSL